MCAVGVQSIDEPWHQMIIMVLILVVAGVDLVARSVRISSPLNGSNSGFYGELEHLVFFYFLLWTYQSTRGVSYSRGSLGLPVIVEPSAFALGLRLGY
jgi:hypothetical protein